MAKRVLAIGVGGSGKAALTILKERLEETYGRVPDSVVLLSLDTDSLRDLDRFAGTQLNPAFDERNRLPEFQHIVSPGGMTMDAVFASIRSGKTAAYMDWLEHEKLDRMLSPAERDIRGGAQQRRPIGRTAFFLRYANPIYQSIIEAIGKMYGDADDDQRQAAQSALRSEDIEKGKRMIFLISSVAGGTGSGMLLDVANLVRHAVNSNQNWQSVSASGIIVLPDAFAGYTRFMDDPTNLKPNSYAALRELDRFMRVHSSFLPYMVRYAESEQSLTWSTNQPLDHCYLVDTASRSSSQDFDLGGDPMKGVFPVIADFVMAHVDNSLGDALATLRSNAGLHYDKSTGRMYSGFNVMTYIFPVDDVIESFAYRFIRELLAREFLPIVDEKRRGQTRVEALAEIERAFTTSSVAGRANPNIIQKAIVATRRINPERPDMSWPGLFGMISLSDSGFAEHYQSLQQSLEYLSGSLVLTKDGDYRKEGFEEGAARLLNFTEQFLDDFLGPQIDPDDPDSRAGGDWDAILGLYRDALRLRYSEVLDAALLDALNRRDERRVLLGHRLPFAGALVEGLKGYLVAFRAALEKEWADLQLETRLRQVSEELRNAITWMNDTRNERYLPPIWQAPRQAQESFKSQFIEKMQLVLHQRVYRTVLDVLDSLGAGERDSAGQPSVADTAVLELENWDLTLQDVDRLVQERIRLHEANRAEKRVRVRNYLTNPEVEEDLYRRPEHLPTIAMRVMGQVGDQKGLRWQRRDDLAPLDFKLVTTWGEQANGPREIVDSWFAGAKQLFGVVRNNVTVAERLAEEFRSHAAFANRCLQVEEPFLRYNPSRNELAPFIERYVSFNIERARDDGARAFLANVRETLRNQGFNADASAESVVACTVVEISRGVSLTAVEPFLHCEPEYRTKLNRGRESIHVFSEEQVATELEQQIPTLGETGNQQRMLSPELVVAMGGSDRLRAFTLACAYGLVYEDTFLDPATGQESTELWLRLGSNGTARRMALSQSRIVRELNPAFMALPPDARTALLYLNSLQNLVLKMTEPPGFYPDLVARVLGELGRRAVPLAGIERPFTLKVAEIFRAVNETAAALGPDGSEVADQEAWRAMNADRRTERLRGFIGGRITNFKRNPDPRVQDLGTVLHLILCEEMNTLNQLTRRG
jgi:hypothetical protein